MAAVMRLAAAVAVAGAVACWAALPARRSGGLATMSLQAEPGIGELAVPAA